MLTADDKSHIRYLVLLGQRDDQLWPNIPPRTVTDSRLWFIGRLPQNMGQFIYGTDYYELMKHHGLQLGYQIEFIYPDTEAYMCQRVLQTEAPVIMLVCTQEVDAITRYNEIFSGEIRDNVLSVLYESVSHLWTVKCARVEEIEGVFDWLYRFAISHYKIDYTRAPFSVHNFGRDFQDVGNVFSPSRVNTQILNSIIANWGYDHELSEEEVIEARCASSHEALVKDSNFDRQDVLISQIDKIRFLERATLTQQAALSFYLDQYRAPLIISMPYTSIDMRTLNIDKTAGE